MRRQDRSASSAIDPGDAGYFIGGVNADRTRKFTLSDRFANFPQITRDNHPQTVESSSQQARETGGEETMAPAYGTKLYQRALGLGALIRGIWQVGE